MQAWCHNFQSGSLMGILALDRTVFGGPIRPDLMSQGLRYEKLWWEQGTESTKNLGQVRGSTRKPFPQKGRGKARVGTLRAPQFRGGYIVHGNRPHDKSIDIPLKVYQSALRSGLASKFSQDQLLVVDSLSLETPSKEELQEKLGNLSIQGRKIYFLYGDEEPNLNLIKAADTFEKRRPRPGQLGEKPIMTSWVRNVILTPILENEMLVMDKAAVEVLEEMYRLGEPQV